MQSDPYPVPSYPLADALASGVPFTVSEDARFAHALSLTRPTGPPVRFIHDTWPPGPLGTWYAKRSWKGRTLTGYAGGHRPRGGGVPGLSASGVRRAIAGLDRQEARWRSGEAKPKPPERPCPCCGRPLPGIPYRMTGDLGRVEGWEKGGRAGAI